MGIRNNLSYIFAHRGLPNVYMENSLTGLNKALEHCDYVETDIRLTKDNNLLLFHDPYINDYLIEDLTIEDISKLLEGISVNEIILESRDQINGKVNFEIKTDNTSSNNIDILFQKVSGIANKDDIISSFHWEGVYNFRDIFTSEYGIILNSEDHLFEAKAMSNHDEKIYFMNVMNTRLLIKIADKVDRVIFFIEFFDRQTVDQSKKNTRFSKSLP